MWGCYSTLSTTPYHRAQLISYLVSVGPLGRDSDWASVCQTLIIIIYAMRDCVSDSRTQTDAVTAGRLYMENFDSLTPSVGLYRCDQQAAFQSFPLHLTTATNFLCPLQLHILSTDSICIAFHPWKTPFHWPQTPSTYGKVVFLWPPDSFSVISTASDRGHKLPVPTTVAQCVH